MPSSFTQSTPPSSPGPDDVWFHTGRGLTFVWTVSSSGHGAWVEAFVPGFTSPPPPVMLSGSPSLPSLLSTSNPNPVVYAAPSPPLGPNDCDLWYDTITGFFFIRYNDGNTVQWVVTNPGRGGSIGPPGPQGDPALLNIPAGTYGDDRHIVVIEVTDDPNQIASMTPVEVDAPTLVDFTDFTNDTLAALALKAPLDSPAFTGGPTAPTPVTADNDTSVATTAFVRAAIAAFSPPPDLTPYALIDSPTFTGDPKAPTPATADNDTSIATTAYVKANIAAIPPTSWGSITGVPATFPPTLPIAQSGVTNLVSDLALKAPLASPAFTGSPTAPTPTPANDSTTKVATTAFVMNALASGASISVGTTPPGSPAPNQMWWNSETGVLFLYYNDGSTTQWVPAMPGGAQAQGFRLLGRATPTAGQTSVDFANLPPDINDLELRLLAFPPATGNIFGLRFFDAAGVISTTGYSWQGSYSNSISTAGTASPIINNTMAGVGYEAAHFLSASVDVSMATGIDARVAINSIRNPGRRGAHWQALLNNSANTAAYSLVISGYHSSTGIITGVRVFFNGGTFAAGGSIALWGSP